MKMMKALSLLALLTLGLTSCSSTGGPSGGLLGLVTGGVLGKLVDGKSNNNSTSSSLFGSSVSGTASSTANSLTGTSNEDDFFGENKGAIVGAASGAIAGLVTDQVRKGEIQKKYDEGYAKAKSDAIKEFYWLKRDAQKGKAGSEENPVQYRYYEVEVPAHTTSDGVFIDRHKRVIEVVE